ncbi:MAG TPA: sortase [Chloroflexota bacterium]|nr:sortase [Chloroflexota bacterium]
MRVRLRRVGRWLSNAMIAAGVLIIGGTGGLYAYTHYEEARIERDVVAFASATPLPLPTRAIVFTPTAIPATPTPTDAQLERLRQLEFRREGPPPTLTPSPVPTATPTPVISPAQRVVAAAIKLDTKVVESKVVNGEWQVPKFVAGHLQGTADPLEGGNVVLCGHIDSISSGDVFANIGKLKPGDAIEVYTQTTVIKYQVARLVVVPNTDVEVVQNHSEETLTLITCTGTWLPLQHDFDRRLVVVADRVA